MRSRSEVRQALQSRSGSACVIPMLGDHAAKLEQVPPDMLAVDAETHARSLRNALTLYDMDGLVLGGDERWLAAATWVTSKPGTTPSDARKKIASFEALSELPSADAVLSSASTTTLLDARGRLRPVIGERAAVGVALADPSQLARQLGRADATSWAHDVVTTAVRVLGPHEPDFMLLFGEEHRVNPALHNLASFFGIPLVHICADAACQQGVVVLPPEDPSAWPAQQVSGAWLYTTAGPLAADADPGDIKIAIQKVRL